MAKKEIQGIPVEDIILLDKIGNGMYTISTQDGKKHDLSLNQGEVVSLTNILRHRKKDDASQEPAGETPADNIPKRELASLDRNLGNRLEVEFKDPNMGGYWASDSDLPTFLSVGYEYARSDDLFDFSSQFADLTVGDGFTPNGHICRDGLTLLKAPKELQKKVDEIFYNRRTRAKDSKFYISTDDLNRKQAQYN